MLKKIFLLIPILPKLGYNNVAYMIWYRLGMKLGWQKHKFPLGKAIVGLFFKKSAPVKNYPEAWRNKTLERANKILDGNLTWFYYHTFQVGNPPKWFQNPFDGSVLNNPKKHWTELSDFDLNTGDIKIIWEPSRFGWLTDLARAYRVSGDEKYLETINQWLEDWSRHNPKNQGPNWKCGQEASIRLMQLITTAQILKQDLQATPNLQQMLWQHLKRIDGNINYGIAQDNNHGTSEAAALYIGAVFLNQQPINNKVRKHLQEYMHKGRKLLVNRIEKLITMQGVFSQRSVNYHRVVVDTLSWVLLNMKRYKEPELAKQIKVRIKSLGEHQYKMISNAKGEAPNLGSNDGAMFLNLHNSNYRDFRPSTQLFFAALNQEKRFIKGSHDEALFWLYPEMLNKEVKIKENEQGVMNIDDELIIMQDKDLKLFLRLPNDRFRFATCDALHLDVWYKGKNILGDSGSFSYNSIEESEKYESVLAHNTIQFGEYEQMPKISRFLYGNWLKAKNIKISTITEKKWFCKASYIDFRENMHTRSIQWEPKSKCLFVTDTVVSNYNEEKKLYWHVFDNALKKHIKVHDEKNIVLQPSFSSAYHSQYYLQKSEHLSLSYKTKSRQFNTIIQL